MKLKTTKLQERLTLGTEPSIYGCDPLFDICSDADLMSLSFTGSNPFLDWLGWERTETCLIKKNFISYVRADANGSIASVGYLADPCADPNKTEWDTCDFTLEDFARLRRAGPVRDITKTHLNYCANQPRFRLDGTMINDQREYDMRMSVEVIMQDLLRMVIEGDASTPGQFDGLEILVNDGYVNSSGVECPLMDSVVVDWNENDMDGGAGITWNAAPISATVGLVSVLQAIFRQIRTRVSWAPSLNRAPLGVGDVILLMPSSFIPCLLDAYTCWSVCDGANVTLNSFEGRKFRENLMGGMFGAGRIFLEGFEIPIMPYDWGLINGSMLFDMYMLTGYVGNQKILQGQYNDMARVAAKRTDRFATDRGLLLTWSEDDMTCEQQIVEMQPRILSWAPWAQARIQDVSCQTLSQLSQDPWNEYFPYP